MSTAEYLELLSMASSNAGQHAMVSVSILFAYIIAAYLVGSKLSKFQATAISLLYSAYFVIPLFATLAEQERGAKLAEQFSELHPEQFEFYYSSGLNMEFYSYTTIIVAFFAWAFSIYFMYDRRNIRTGQSSASET